MGFRKLMSELPKSQLEEVCKCDYHLYVDYKVDELFQFNMDEGTAIVAKLNGECSLVEALDINGHTMRLEPSEILKATSYCKERIEAKYN